MTILNTIKALNSEAAYQAFGNKNSKVLNINKISLDPLKSFQEWRQNLKVAFKKLKATHSICEEVANSFQEALNESHSIYKIEGKSDVIIYHWPNAEPKIVPLWGNIIIQSDLYWLEFLPFLNEIEKNATKIDTFKTYKFQPNDFLYILEGNFQPIKNRLIISQNNHFGHYLLDHLPLIELLNGPFGGINVNSYKPIDYPYKDSIIDLLLMSIPQSIDNKMLTRSRSTEKSIFNQLAQPLIITHEKLIDLLPTNHYTNAYLWSQIRDKFHLNNSLALKIQDQKSTKVMLIRSGDYKTRIENWEDIKKYLTEIGFIFIDPSQNSAHEILVILRNAGIVICESGSSTLNATIFANPKARIISLNPKRLFQQPNLSMIHGGLPYLLAFCDRIEFILGETTEQAHIPSSDIARYKISKINDILGEI